MIEITKEEFLEVLNYVNAKENATIPSVGAISKLFTLTASLGKKLNESVQSEQNKNFILQNKIRRFENRQQIILEENSFKESGLDSVDVAGALLYHLKQNTDYKISYNKVCLILYAMYSSWLASKKERLFIEHPLTHPDGPRFWRVMTRLEKKTILGTSEEYKRIAEQNPGVAVFIRNAAYKYFDYKEEELKKTFINSTPYKTAAPERNGGKWSKEISDAEIYVWKKEAALERH